MIKKFYKYFLITLLISIKKIKNRAFLFVFSNPFFDLPLLLQISQIIFYSFLIIIISLPFCSFLRHLFFSEMTWNSIVYGGGFDNPASAIMEGIRDFNNMITYFLIFIAIFVGYILLRIIYWSNLHFKKKVYIIR